MATPKAWVEALPRLRHYGLLNRDCRRGFEFRTDGQEGWFVCKGCGWERSRVALNA